MTGAVASGDAQLCRVQVDEGEAHRIGVRGRRCRAAEGAVAIVPKVGVVDPMGIVRIGEAGSEGPATVVHVTVGLVRITGIPAVRINPPHTVGGPRDVVEHMLATVGCRLLGSTESPTAVVAAGIVIVFVLVVTIFDAGLDVPIAATGLGAIVEAGVRLNVVAIIALVDFCLDMPIATTGVGAVVQAGVCLVIVAIVAGFHLIVDKAVAAAG